MPPRVIHWFRTDLRLHDNPALQAALDLKPECLYPIFCFDPRYAYSQLVGVNRWQFLLDSLQNLSDNLTKTNPATQLFVVRGPPTTILPALFKAWRITHLCFEEDDDEYTMERDREVVEAAKAAGVEVVSKLGHTLWDANIILAQHKNKPITSYGPFVKIVEALPTPPRPTLAPTELPNPGSTEFSFDRNDHSVQDRRQADINADSRHSEDSLYETFSGPDGKFKVPTFEQLALQPATSHHRGGEDRALAILDEWLETRQAEVLKFEKPKTSPAAFDPPATTTLSPHLHFGTLSVRRFFWGIKDLAKGKAITLPPVSLIGQLYWREFFHTAQVAIPNYQRMRGNPVCRYINWRLQNQYDEHGGYLPRQDYQFNDPEAEEHFAAWTEGRTGFPWIDAIMRQLRQEGWIHHLARHSVACFLTRGHMYISWERGAEVFDKYLVDWDPALNAGNWMWLSASAFFHSIFRVYSPIAFGKKWDKSGQLIRKYCPELVHYPDKYIYEPWTAPIGVQQKAKCIIGKDYPKPVLDEKVARQDSLKRMEAAYAAKLHGDDPSALDGTAAPVVNTVKHAVDKVEKVTGHKRKASTDIAYDDKKQLKLDAMFSPSGSKSSKG